MRGRNDKIGNKKKTKKAPLGFTDPALRQLPKLLPPQPRHGESDSKKAGAGKILVAAAAEFQLRPGSRLSFNWDQVPGCPSLLGLGAGFRSVVTHLLCRAGCRIVV